MAKEKEKDIVVRKPIDHLASVVLALLSLVWIYPIVMIVFNSFKVESAISTDKIFTLPVAH